MKRMAIPVLISKWFNDILCTGYLTLSNYVTSSKRVDTLICHTTMCRNAINEIINNNLAIIMNSIR